MLPSGSELLSENVQARSLQENVKLAVGGVFDGPPESLHAARSAAPVTRVNRREERIGVGPDLEMVVDFG